MRLVITLLIVWGTVAEFTARAADGSSSAALGKSPVVLELFTSEGCSSCPPADRLLGALDAKQPIPNADLVVLSEHVDYWDDGGWRDPYSSNLFTERQQSYARHFGPDSIYTPQLVVDGKREAVGGNAAAVQVAIQEALRDPKVAITMLGVTRTRAGISLRLSSPKFPSGTHPATVYIALAENSVQSHVTRGENGGRELSHTAVVRVLRQVGTVTAGTALSQDIFVAVAPKQFQNGLRLIAFVQEKQSLHILGAAQMKI